MRLCCPSGNKRWVCGWRLRLPIDSAASGVEAYEPMGVERVFTSVSETSVEYETHLVRIFQEDPRCRPMELCGSKRGYVPIGKKLCVVKVSRLLAQRVSRPVPAHVVNRKLLQETPEDPDSVPAHKQFVCAQSSNGIAKHEKCAESGPKSQKIQRGVRNGKGTER